MGLNIPRRKSSARSSRRQFCFYCHLSGPFISGGSTCTIKMSEKMSNLARGDIEKVPAGAIFMSLICAYTTCELLHPVLLGLHNFQKPIESQNAENERIEGLSSLR